MYCNYNVMEKKNKKEAKLLSIPYPYCADKLLIYGIFELY